MYVVHVMLCRIASEVSGAHTRRHGAVAFFPSAPIQGRQQMGSKFTEGCLKLLWLITNL